MGGKYEGCPYALIDLFLQSRNRICGSGVAYL